MRQGRLAHGRNLRYDGHADRQHCARTVAPIAGYNPSAQRFDKATANRQPEPSAGTPAILRLDAIELIENTLQIGGRNARTLIDDLDLYEFPVTGCADIDAATDGRVFRCIVQKVKQDLLKQHGVESEHRQVRLDIDLDPVAGEDAASTLQR
jgi:hypothetical protein